MTRHYICWKFCKNKIVTVWSGLKLAIFAKGLDKVLRERKMQRLTIWRSSGSDFGVTLRLKVAHALTMSKICTGKSFIFGVGAVGNCFTVNRISCWWKRLRQLMRFLMLWWPLFVVCLFFQLWTKWFSDQMVQMSPADDHFVLIFSEQ